MIKIEYPEHSFRRRVQNGKELIFDQLRKVWLLLTPEEWVRQNFVQYLIQVQRYPAALIAIEKKILLGDLVKRFDLLVFDRFHRPWMMIECKSMEVQLTQAVLEQLLRYNISVPVNYLVITNGIYCAGFKKENNELKALTELPVFPFDED